MHYLEQNILGPSKADLGERAFAAHETEPLKAIIEVCTLLPARLDRTTRGGIGELCRKMKLHPRGRKEFDLFQSVGISDNP